MDLTALDVKAASEKGAVLHLKHPMTGEKLFDGDEPVTVTVIGRDSPSVRSAMLDIERRKAKGEDITKEDEGLELLAVVTLGWSGIEFDGKALEYSKSNARKLYSDPRTDWIGEQVGPFALNRRNFAHNLPND